MVNLSIVKKILDVSEKDQVSVGTGKVSLSTYSRRKKKSLRICTVRLKI